MTSNTFIVSFLHNGKFYGWVWNDTLNEWFANLPPNPSFELLSKLEQTRPRNAAPKAAPPAHTGPAKQGKTRQEALVEAALAHRPAPDFQNPYRFADCE